MMKVLVVDDERPIREWIAFCIRNISKEFEICGLASNGKEALDIFSEYLPEILITDIKMPVMNGLDLIKEAKEIKSDVETIVLTSHSDFEYARSAIKYGVSEYVLKTEVDELILKEMLERLKTKINMSTKDSSEKINKIQLRRESFIKSLLDSDTSCITEKILEEQSISLKDDYIFAMALKFCGNMNFFTGSNAIQIPKSEVLINIFYFSYDKDTFVFLGNIRQTPSTLLQFQSIYEFVLEFQKTHVCTIGISGVYKGLKNIPVAVSESVKQLKMEFYNGEKSINRFNNIQDEEALKNFKSLSTQVKKLVDARDVPGACKKVDEFLSYIEKNKISNIESVKQCAVNMVDYVLSSELIRNENIILGEDVCDRIYNAKFYNDFQAMIKRFFAELASQHDNSTMYSFHVLKAIQYIKNHYAQNITLSDISKHLNLNAEYFCRIFKEETHMTFSHYLIDVRLNKSAHLLKNTSMKVYEVAEAVGYPNISYYSKIFKKKFGCNPFDFRNARE